MGIFDELKHKAEELGEKAKEGLGDAVDKAGDLLGDARDKAGDLVEDVRGRVGDHGGDHAPTGESEDIGPDSSATDAVDPGYVTGEDAADDAIARGEAGDADDLDDDGGPDGGLDGGGLDEDSDESDADLDALGGDTAATSGSRDPGADDDTGTDVGGDAQADVQAETERLDPVATDVDPYDEPLSESIGAEIADSDIDRETLAEAVEPSDPER